MSLTDVREKKFFLHPGQILVTAEKYPVVTILGSCVALTVFSPERGIGGIFHALLPEHSDKKLILKNSPPVSPDPDYIDYSFYYLKKKFSDLGIDISDTRLMIFGGGDVLQPLMKSSSGTVGKKNVDMIRKIIEKENLKITAEDTGGTKARKIIFNPGTGKTSVEYIKCDIPVTGSCADGKENRGINRR